MMQVINLSGPPQSGKSSALMALYRHFDGLRMSPVMVLPTDTEARCYPEHWLVKTTTLRGLHAHAHSRALLIESVERFPAFDREGHVIMRAMNLLNQHRGHRALVIVRTTEEGRHG